MNFSLFFTLKSELFDKIFKIEHKNLNFFGDRIIMKL